MSFLSPLLLLFSLLAGPIVLLYMLKLRRREVEVSSTLLWQLLLRDREANAPWQKLKRNLLLLLQLLLLAALVVALARPFWPVPVVASGSVVVLLDGSASMLATDVAPTRFEAARTAARQLIDGLSADARMTLILVGRQPTVLASATGDKNTLRDALGRAAPSLGLADWESAVALAAGAVRAGDVAKSTVVILSDGGLPTSGLPPLPGQVRYVPIGQTAENLALSALALRPTDAGAELFLSVTNHGTQTREVIVSIRVDGELFNAQKLTVPAGGTAPFILTALPANSAAYEARLSPPPPAQEGDALDAFPLDDMAYAVFQPPAAGRALVVSPGNRFLEQVLTAFSKALGLQAFRLKPEAALPTEPFDLYILDTFTQTTRLPDGDLLIIAPPADTTFTSVVSGTVFSTKSTFSLTSTKDFQLTASPLAQNMDWGNVHLKQATRIDTTSDANRWLEVVVNSDRGPLVLAGEKDGRRVAIITFRLQDSDLPLQVAFPVLMANLLNYLSPAQAFNAPQGLHPGETLAIRPGAGATQLRVTLPDGKVLEAPVTSSGVLFAQTDQLGLYSVRSESLDLGQFAVNLFNPIESQLQPASAIRLGSNAVAPALREETGQYEIWPWLAGVALVVLLVEWWLYHRSATLPSQTGWRGWFQRTKV